MRKFIRGKNGNGSPYALIRLLFPGNDGARPHFGIKEKGIIKHWTDALALNKDSSAYHKLSKYTDPSYTSVTAQGDLSQAIQEVLEIRIGNSLNRQFTIGQMNKLFDELIAIKNNTLLKGGEKSKAKTAWVNKLIQHGLSALEHKWIVRIILHKCEIGIGFETFINYLHDRAKHIYNSHRSLKYLCSALSDQKWLTHYIEKYQAREKEALQHKRSVYMPRVDEDVSVGITLAPHLSSR